MKDYKKILEGVVNIINTTEKSDIGFVNICTYISENCPELKESEDEKIRGAIIHFISHTPTVPKGIIGKETMLAWLEKQKEFVSADFDDVWETADCNKLTAPLEKYSKDAIKEMCHAWYDKGIELERRNWLEKQGTPAELSEEEQNRFAKGVLSSCAMSFIDYLDAHKYEGKMCVSNGECEDIENAFHNAMWDRLHRYYCKYIEKQGEKKSFDYENANMQQNDFAPKSAIEATKEEKVDNANKVEPFDKYEGLTDFERTLADICMGWIGEEHGWKQYIKDNADVLLRIAVKMFNSVQDAPFEQKSAETVKWSPQEESCICQLESLVKEQWRQAERVHNSVNIKKMSELIFFLKTLNPNKKPQGIISAETKEAMYNKTEWSKEIEAAITLLKDIAEEQEKDYCPHNANDLRKAAQYLETCRPQSTWKPSDEQIGALEHFVRSITESGFASPYDSNTKLVYSLLNDLKKLKL